MDAALVVGLHQRGESLEGVTTQGYRVVTLKPSVGLVVVPTELAQELSTGATEGFGGTIAFHTAAAALDARGRFHGSTVAGYLHLEGKVEVLGKGCHAPFGERDAPLTCGARDGTSGSLG